MAWDWTTTRVTVTGGAGFLGSVVCRKLQERGCKQIDVPRRAEYDLTREADVARMYETLAPDVVIHLAAEVGGIEANRRHPGRFFYANMAMGLHLIEHARRRKIRKFVCVGTVCAYPRITPVPFREDDLWNGYPEETNAPYGIAKKSLFVMLDAYHRQYQLPSAVVVPTNLYGPGDNFDPTTSHVIPALIRRFVQATQANQSTVTCWGTGSASRDFLYVDDAADGVLAATERMEYPIPINLGTGQEIEIQQLAATIAAIIGFSGSVQWNPNKPDGQPRRRLDLTRATVLLNWRAATTLNDGILRTIDWYRQHPLQPVDSPSVVIH